MGEIADMMLDGTLDAATGEYLGPGAGYPRSMDPDHPDYIGKKKDPKTTKPVFGVENFLKKRGETEFSQITDDYFVQIKRAEESHQKRCEYISQDFGTFVKWYNKRKK